MRAPWPRCPLPALLAACSFELGIKMQKTFAQGAIGCARLLIQLIVPFGFCEFRLPNSGTPIAGYFDYVEFHDRVCRQIKAR